MRIALLVDSLDATRQIHSDAGEALSEAVELLVPFYDSLYCQIVSNRDAESFFMGLSTGSWDCIVLASNSIRHPDSSVREAFEKHLENIGGFIASGGSLLALHQFASSLDKLELPDGGSISFEERAGITKSQQITPMSRGDQILNFPFAVDVAEELSSKDSQLGKIVSWMQCKFPESSMFPIIGSGNDEVLLARTRFATNYRVVVSAIPLDWHGATRLLANTLSFLLSGTPRHVYWSNFSPEEESPTRPESGKDGFFCIRSEQMESKTVKWLSSQSIIETSLGPKLLSDLSTTRGIDLEVGKILDGEFEISGKVSLTPERAARQVLEGLDFSEIGPNFVTQPYPLRNIIESLTYMAREFPELQAWNPEQDQEFKDRFTSLEFANMTVTSALASLQTASALGLGERTKSPIVRRIRSLVADTENSELVELMLAAVSRQISLENFLESIALIANRLSTPNRLRAFEWIGFLIHFLKMESSPEGVRTANQALFSDEVFTRSWVENDLSIDGTCSLVLALVCEGQSLPKKRLIALRQGLSVLRNFHNESVAPEQMSLRLRAATSLTIANGIFPDVVGEVREFLFPHDFSRTHSHSSKASKSNIDSITRLSEQSKILQDKNSLLLNELRLKKPVWWLGGLTAWVLSVFVLVALGFAWVQVLRFETIASIFAVPLGIAALWIANQLLIALDRNYLTPKWLSRGLRKIPWFKRKNI